MASPTASNTATKLVSQFSDKIESTGVIASLNSKLKESFLEDAVELISQFELDVKKAIVTEADQERVKTVIDAVRTTVDRNRAAFLAVNLACITFFGVLFNHHFAWIRMAGTRLIHDWNATPMKGEEKHVNIIGEEITKGYINDLNFVTIPLIGVRFSSSDIVLVGSVAFALIAFWFYFATRREHQTVNAAVKDIENIQTRGDDAAYLAQTAYLGLVSCFQFTASFGGDSDDIREKDVAKYKLLYFSAGLIRLVRHILNPISVVISGAIALILSSIPEFEKMTTDFLVAYMKYAQNKNDRLIVFLIVGVLLLLVVAVFSAREFLKNKQGSALLKLARRQAPRSFVAILMFSPCIFPIVGMILDVISIFNPLVSSKPLNSVFEPGEWISFIIRELIALGISFWSFGFCCGTFFFDIAEKRSVEELRDKIFPVSPPTFPVVCPSPQP